MESNRINPASLHPATPSTLGFNLPLMNAGTQQLPAGGNTPFHICGR